MSLKAPCVLKTQTETAMSAGHLCTIGVVPADSSSSKDNHQLQSSSTPCTNCSAGSLCPAHAFSFLLQVSSHQCSVSQLCKDNADQPYLLAPTQGSVQVVLSKGSQPADVLKAFVHARVTSLMGHTMPSPSSPQVSCCQHGGQSGMCHNVIVCDALMARPPSMMDG